MSNTTQSASHDSGRARTRAGILGRHRNAVVLLLVSAIVFPYYCWAVRSSGSGFSWGAVNSGYYNMLGRAFARGDLHLEVVPVPELLAMPNPWAASVPQEYKWHDMVLFNKRYYLYHGAGPAVMLFTPWRWISGKDCPEAFALLVFAMGGFLAMSGALLRMVKLSGLHVTPVLLVPLLLALAVGNGVPFLTNRIAVYEIAIAGGYFSIATALYCLVRSFDTRRRAAWLAAAGLMFGMAIACRPHLGMVGGLAGAMLLVRLWKRHLTMRELAAFAVPFAFAGCAVALYNYARFGDPFEFGVRFMLTGPEQQRVKLAREYVPPGLYYFVLARPAISEVVPWIRPVLRCPYESDACLFPKEYFVESTAGVLWLAPLLLALPLALFARGIARWILAVTVTAAIGLLVFLSFTGFTSQRYVVDFLPLALWSAVVALALTISTASRFLRVAAILPVVLATLWGIVANLSLQIGGPQDDFLRHRPRSYLRLAGWLSFSEESRPMGDPEIEVVAAVRFGAAGIYSRQPLVTCGRSAYRYVLEAEPLPNGRLRFWSRADGSTATAETALPASAFRLSFRYRPDIRTVTVEMDGQTLLTHKIRSIVTAPAEVTPGENLVEYMVPGRIEGKVEVISKTVRALQAQV